MNMKEYSFQLDYFDNELSKDENEYIRLRVRKILINFSKKQILISMYQSSDLFIYTVFNKIIENKIKEMSISQLTSNGDESINYIFKNISTNDIILKLTYGGSNYSFFELNMKYRSSVVSKNNK